LPTGYFFTVRKEGGTSSDTKTFYALPEAVRESRSHDIEWLLANQLQRPQQATWHPNDFEKDLIHEAAKTKNKKGTTPLHVAANNGHKDVVQLLLVNGAEVNARDNKKMTPLHIAVINGHKEVIELLLTNGADANAKNNREMAPSHLALANDRHEIAAILTQYE
jgi:ankyrin repeat protein